MFNNLLLVTAALAALPAVAIGQQASARPDPADASIAVPTTHYKSAFKDYRAAAEDEATPDAVWREVNNTVRDLGGHAGHIKEDAVRNPAQSAVQTPHRHDCCGGRQ